MQIRGRRCLAPPADSDQNFTSRAPVIRYSLLRRSGAPTGDKRTWGPGVSSWGSDAAGAAEVWDIRRAVVVLQAIGEVLARHLVSRTSPPAALKDTFSGRRLRNGNPQQLPRRVACNKRTPHKDFRLMGYNFNLIRKPTNLLWGDA